MDVSEGDSEVPIVLVLMRKYEQHDAATVASNIGNV